MRCDPELTLIEGIEPSSDLRERIAIEHRTSILSFSCGKDSIAAWLSIRDTMGVLPYYCYLVPDLEFVEESLAYYEGAFGCKIIRLPHPSLYRWIGNMVFAPPERCRVIEGMSLPTFDRADLLKGLREWKGLPSNTPCACGVRACDSIMRRVHFKTHGAYNKREDVWYPIWDWNKAKMINEIKRSGIKLPVDYSLFARSFDGLDYRFLKPIKDFFPRDYARILEYFPLAELELKRAEFSSATYE